jgi:hypothetical protein
MLNHHKIMVSWNKCSVLVASSRDNTQVLAGDNLVVGPTK